MFLYRRSSNSTVHLPIQEFTLQLFQKNPNKNLKKVISSIIIVYWECRCKQIQLMKVGCSSIQYKLIIRKNIQKSVFTASMKQRRFLLMEEFSQTWEKHSIIKNSLGFLYPSESTRGSPFNFLLLFIYKPFTSLNSFFLCSVFSFPAKLSLLFYHFFTSTESHPLWIT